MLRWLNKLFAARNKVELTMSDTPKPKTLEEIAEDRLKTKAIEEEAKRKTAWVSANLNKNVPRQVGDNAIH